MPDDSDDSTVRIPTVVRDGEPIVWEEVNEEWYNQTQEAESVKEKVIDEYGEMDGVKAIGIEQGDEKIGERWTFAIRVEITSATAMACFPDEIDGVSINLYEVNENGGKLL